MTLPAPTAYLDVTAHPPHGTRDRGPRDAPRRPSAPTPGSTPGAAPRAD
ncbi:hypothetical protein [uncultured Serinicoccus sp.]|nr:hypothetical protein [uncultured Serinicoccus sp.]